MGLLEAGVDTMEPAVSAGRERACARADRNGRCWRCIVAGTALHGRGLPAEYIRGVRFLSALLSHVRAWKVYARGDGVEDGDEKIVLLN